MKQHLGWWFPDGETHFQRMLDKSVAKGGPNRYQWQVRDKSISYAKNKRTAIDIGANVGLWSRDLCEHFTHVIAFEPVEMFRDCLIANIESWNLHVEPVALGDTKTTANLIITEENMGHTHVDPASIGVGSTKVCRLDDFNYIDVDYIKIDCEGFEYRVLLGAENTVRNNRPIIVVEQKPHDTYSDQYGQHEAVKLLESWGMVKVDQVKDDWIMGWK